MVIILVFLVWQPELPTETEINELTERFGSLGPLAIIAIIIIETVIAPIPGTIFPIVIGVLYGVWPGILYAWIGNVVGSVIAFFISRKLGRPFAEKIVSKDKIEKYDKFLHRNKTLIWLIYAIPIFPIDIISFVIGLSNIKFKRFLLIVSVGFIINLLILVSFGDQLLTASGGAKVGYALGIMAVILIAVTIEKLQFSDDK